MKRIDRCFVLATFFAVCGALTQAEEVLIAGEIIAATDPWTEVFTSSERVEIVSRVEELGLPTITGTLHFRPNSIARIRYDLEGKTLAPTPSFLGAILNWLLVMNDQYEGGTDMMAVLTKDLVWYEEGVARLWESPLIPTLGDRFENPDLVAKAVDVYIVAVLEYRGTLWPLMFYEINPGEPSPTIHLADWERILDKKISPLSVALRYEDGEYRITKWGGRITLASETDVKLDTLLQSVCPSNGPMFEDWLIPDLDRLLPPLARKNGAGGDEP